MTASTEAASSGLFLSRPAFRPIIDFVINNQENDFTRNPEKI
ncbi:hypothetical protein OH687_04105 [Burkholderia anthina]|nr:hypothetical protein OH687_04105 [Burkholderia anthina]